MLKRVIVILVFIVFMSGIAFAIEFTADTIMIHGGYKTTGKIYYKDNKFRIDMKTPQEISNITRLDKKVVWSIMHDQKMYMEMPITEDQKPKVEKEYEGEIERKLISKETLNGHPTEKYLITFKTGNEEKQIYQWWATDIKFPIKTSAVDGSFVQEYKNIQMSSLPDSLFEVPKGYKKFSIPGGMNIK